MATESHANTRIRASVHSVHSTFYLTEIFYNRFNLVIIIISRRIYYGHCGQSLKALQTPGLRAIKDYIYYGHYCGQSCSSLNRQVAYVED